MYMATTHISVLPIRHDEVSLDVVGLEIRVPVSSVTGLHAVILSQAFESLTRHVNTAGVFGKGI